MRTSWSPAVAMVLGLYCTPADAFDFTAQELPGLMNSRASSIGWPTRATLQKCLPVDAVHGTICTYDVARNVAMSTVLYNGDTHVGSVALAMQPGTDPDPFAKSVLLVATLCSPDITSDERTQLVKDLFAVLSTTAVPSEKTIALGNASYFVTRTSKLGFVVRADDKAND